VKNPVSPRKVPKRAAKQANKSHLFINDDSDVESDNDADADNDDEQDAGRRESE